MADNKKIYSKLPAVQQTTAIKNFFESTVEQLFSKSNTESIQGFVGSPRSQDVGITGEYLREPTVTKRFYGLSPTVNTVNPDTGESENLIFYDELIDTLRVYGVDTTNHNKIFGETYAAFMPPVDVDKLINYSEYYWAPQGPSTIRVSGTAQAPIDIDRDVIGKVRFTPPEGKTFRNGMIVEFVGDYVIPQNKAYTEYIVEGVGSSIMLLPKKDNFSTRFTSSSETEYDYHSFTLDNQEINGYPNTRFSAGTVDDLRIINAGQGYIAPELLIYDKVHSTDATLISQYPAFASTYIDDNGNTVNFVDIEQIILSITDRNDLDEFVELSQLLDTNRTGNRAIADITLSDTGGIQATISQVGENYAGDVSVVVYDRFTTVEIDTVNTLAENNDSAQYVTDTIYLTSTDDVKVGQIVTGYFSAIIKQVIPADVPAGVLASIVLDRSVEIVQTGIESNNTLRIRGTGFSALAVRDDVNTLGTAVTTTLTTQAKVGVNPNTQQDYFFTGGTRSWDKDVDGDGIGDLAWAGLVTQSEQDYILQQRGATNRNVWSRVNFWYHRDNFLDAGDALPNRELRAMRPIVEFSRDLELYNHAKTSAGTVIFAANELTLADLIDAPSTTTVDGVPVDGATFIFPNEESSVSKYIYTARVNADTGTLVITRVGDPVANPPLAEDGDSDFIPFTAKTDQAVQILSGQYNIGKEYVYTGTEWKLAQEKITVNQAPLFNLYDDNGVLLSDPVVYPNSTFTGNRIFGYATEATQTGSVISTQNDPVLGFPVVYKQYKASSEIVFANFQQTDTYTYREVTDTVGQDITGYQFYKNSKTGNFHSYWQFGDQPNKQRIVSTYKLTQFDVDKQRVTFSIGCIPNRDADLNSSYDIVVEVNGKRRTDFTYGNTLASFIDFDQANFSAGDFIEISALSDQGVLSTQNSSKFELPISWGHNPYNQSIEYTSEPEYLEHFTAYMANQPGFQGDVLAANNYSNTVKDIQHAKNITISNSNTLLGAMLLDDQPYNLVNALRFSAQEFAKYKARFLHELTTYYSQYNTDQLTSEQVLEQVLRQLISFKVGREVFNRTYIVPFGDNTTVETFTLGVDQDTVTLTMNADLDKIENSLLIYKNDRLLCVDKCYEIVNFSPLTIKIYASTSAGDKIVAKLYGADRDSAQCPPTPSTMGITPLIQPEIILDDTFAEPLEVIVGHDGSKTPTYGDLRDQIILDFETRIYNSAKGEFREKNSVLELNPLRVRSGAFRDTGYSYTEWFSLLRHGFSKWVSENNLDPVINEFYDQNDPWTWNYGDNTFPGHWRGVYEFYYDTDQPHVHPWEMLGFTEKPLWWSDEYGDDYSSKNTKLWRDLEQGIIRQGVRQNTLNDAYLKNNPFRRLGLHEVIPVNESGELIAPAYLMTTGTTQLVTFWENQDTGDHDPDFAFRTDSYLNTDGISVSHDDNKVYVQSQALVNHSLPVDTDVLTDYVTLFGNPVESQDISYAIPRVNLNTVSTNPTIMPIQQAVAVAVNGLPIFNTDYGQSWNNAGAWFYDYTRLEQQVDLTYISSNSNGLVHYHAITPNIVELEDWDNTQHSPVVGWAFDGLPIYGPYGYADPADATSDIVRMKSAWELRDGLRTSGPGGAHTGVFIQDYKLNSSLEGSTANKFRDGYLDRYNMRYSITPDSPTQPIWHYVVTVDEQHEPVFPYHVGGGVKNVDQWAGLYYGDAVSVGEIGEITVVDQGGLYTTATVTINGDGSGASAQAVIEDGKIVRVDVTDPGSNYTYATVTLTGDGVRAKLAIALSTVGNNFNNAIVNADAVKSLTSEQVKRVDITGVTNKQWKFGDTSPVEYAWVKSETYMYSVAEAMLIAKPGLFAKVFSDPVNLYRPTANTKLLLSTKTKQGWDFRDPEQFSIHGDTDSAGDFVTNVGYTQFINSWLQFQGLETARDFVEPLRTLNYKLAHRMNGFVDKDTMTVRTDQFSNDGKATSLIIPKENTHVTMHPSNYKSRNFYSGVVVEKTAAGYRVNGYDKNRGYFEVMELDKTGEKQGVEVGGKPANYVQWEPNSSYRKGTIVQHTTGYYQAPLTISSGATFDRTLWQRLPKLPQENAASATLYTKTTGVVQRVNYQTEYTTAQEVYDFLIGLNMYTKVIGYDYDDYNSEINAVSDWIYAAKQFLFWTTGKWEIGNTLELSPMAKSVKFIAPRGFIAEIKRQDREQFNVVDHEGVVIDPRECEIIRESDAIIVRPPAGREIYGVTLYTKEIDHALVVDNLTEFNDVIFNPVIDQKHRRLKVKATRTANWTGKLLTEGFIVDDDELLPNLDNLAETMGRYQEVGFVPVDKSVYTITRSQYGYAERAYLRDLDVLDEQQFDFYRGMIQNKGTAESLTRIARSSAVVQGNVTVYDEWALRVGDFGDTENNQSIELRLDKNEIVSEPQLIQTVLPENITYGVSDIEVIDARYTYSAAPKILISAPTEPGGVRATAVAVLDDQGKLAAFNITQPGSGYTPNEINQVAVVAAEVSTDSTDTRLQIASAEQLPGYIDLDRTSVSVTITDHITDTTATIAVDTAPDNITVDDIVSAINDNSAISVSATAIETLYNNGVTETVGYNVFVSGNDFTIASGADIGLVDGRYQPKQRFGLVSAKVTTEYQTTTNDITLTIDDVVIPNTTDTTTNWYYTAGKSLTATVDKNYPVLDPNNVVDGKFAVDYGSVTLPLAGGALLTDNLERNQQAQYEFVEVYINGTRITNTVDSYTSGQISHQGTLFTLTENSITFPDIRRLPRDVLNIIQNPPADYDTTVQRDTLYGFTQDTVIDIVEKSTVNLDESLKQDLAGSILRIQITAQEGILVRVEPRRTYAITNDSLSDDVITIDIDDNQRFVKKPITEIGQGLWPTTDKVNHTGLTDEKYINLRNAGYVRPQDVNHRAFDLASLPDLYSDDMILKPKAGDFIHIAKSENQDWNVYRLQPTEASQRILYRNEDGSVNLLTDYSLFNYLDSNQIGEDNTGKYLDYYLSIDNKNISDNVVVWTNEEIVKSKQYSVAEIQAPRMVEARIQSIRPRNLVPIDDIQPARGKVYGGVEISQVSETSDVITLTGLNFTNIAPGDLVSLKNNIGTVNKYDAVITHGGGNTLVFKTGHVESVQITSGGSGYTDVPTVAFSASPEGDRYTTEGTATVTASIAGVTVVDTGNVLGSVTGMPAIEIDGDGTGAVGNVSITGAEIVGFEVLDGGAGYTTPPTITITGANTSAASATVSAENLSEAGEVLAVTAVDFGAGYSSDTATVSVNTPAGGRAATIVPILRGNAAVTMTAAGSGYTFKPTVTIDSAEVESATAVLDATVTGITIQVSGLGYTTAPAITITGTNTAPASATAVLNNGIQELEDAIATQGLGAVRVTVKTEAVNTLAWRIDPPLDATEQALLDTINSINNTSFPVTAFNTSGEFTIESDLFADPAVADNVERSTYLYVSYDNIDSTQTYSVLTVTPTTMTIQRPNSARSTGLELTHHNTSRIVAPAHQYTVGDVIRISSNTFRGMYQVKSVRPDSFVIEAPYIPGFTDGDVIQEGVEIKTTVPHGLTSMYAAQGKHIAVHFAEPLYYNKVYQVSQVTTDTIIINGFWPKDRRTHTYYEHKYGFLTGATPYNATDPAAGFDSATNTIKVTADVRLSEDQILTYAGNGMMIPPSQVSVVDDHIIVDPLALPSNTSISVRVDVVRQIRRQSYRYPTLTTMDHNLVTMNGSTLRVDSYNSAEAMKSSINRSIALREQYTNTDSGKFSIKFGMLKDPSKAVVADKSAEEISDYGPYIRDPELIKKLSNGELSSTGDMVLSEVDELEVDEQFNQGPVELGPNKGLRYADPATGIEYIWSPATQSYRALTVALDSDSEQSNSPPPPPAPEYHMANTDTSSIPDWVAVDASEVEELGPIRVMYTADSLVKYGGAFYLATRDITAQYNTDFVLSRTISGVETEFWRLIDNDTVLAQLVNNFLILTRVPGTGTGSPTAVGGKRAFYNMTASVTYTVAETDIEMPRFRLEPNVENSFVVYEAVQNTDDDLYYIKIDSASAPASPHDYYGTVNAYSDFLGYPVTAYYYDNDVQISLDGQGKIQNTDDPIRIQNTGKVIAIGEVEPATFIGSQLVDEPFAVLDGNNSDAVQNILALPRISVRSSDSTSRAHIDVESPGFDQFLLWTAGLTPNEWSPTDSGPGPLPGIDGNPTVLGFGSGYYTANGPYPADYPEVAGLSYNRPIPRLMYSRSYSVFPGFKNYDYVAYQAEDGTIISEEAYNQAVENNENTVNGFLVSDLTEVLLAPEFVDAGDTDTGMRADQVWVACFWTERFTYRNQLVDWDYTNLDANGLPQPIYADYPGTVVRVKYIKLTELPANAVTRRLIPDTGWAGRAWNNRVVDNVDFTDAPEDEIWDIFNPQTYVGGSNGNTSEAQTTTIGVGNVATTGAPTTTGAAPTITTDGALVTQNAYTDTVPTTELGPILNASALAGLPGPCERIDLPQDNIIPSVDDSECTSVNRARYLDTINSTDFAYATDSVVNVGYVEKKLAGIEDVRVFFNTGLSSDGTDFDYGAPYHITVVQSRIPYSQALANDNTLDWWTNSVPILMHTLQSGEGARNDGTQMYHYGVDVFNAEGGVRDSVITQGLGLVDTDVERFGAWTVTNDKPGVIKSGATPAELANISNGVYTSTDSSMVQGLGFMINYGVNCLDGQYLTVFVAHDTDDITNKAVKLVLDYFGEYVEPEITPDIVADDACLQAASRAYQQGAVLKEWDMVSGTGRDGYFGTNDSDGEFDDKNRRNIDNIYFPYARPNSCRSIAQDKNGSRFEVTSDIPNGKSALETSQCRLVSERTIQTMGEVKIPTTRTIEIKGYFRAPTSGLYEFYGNGDDSLWVWVSSAWCGNKAGSVVRVGVNDVNQYAFDPSTIPDGTDITDGYPLDYLKEEYNITGGFFTKDGPPDYSEFTSLDVTSGGGMNFVDQAQPHGYQNTPYYTRDNCVLRTGWHTTNSRGNQYGINSSRHGPYGPVRVKVALKEGEYYFVRIMAGNKHGPGYADLRYNVTGNGSGISGARLTFSGKFCESDNPPAPSPSDDQSSGGGFSGGDDLWWNYNPITGNYPFVNPEDQGFWESSDVDTDTSFRDDSWETGGGTQTGTTPTTPSPSSSASNTSAADERFEACCEAKGVSSLIGGGFSPADAQVECYYTAYGTFPSSASQAQIDRILGNSTSNTTETTTETTTGTTDDGLTFGGGSVVSSSGSSSSNNSVPARGTVLSSYCETTTFQGVALQTGTLVTVYADGAGGTYTERTTDFAACPLPGFSGGGGGGTTFDDSSNINLV